MGVFVITTGVWTETSVTETERSGGNGVTLEHEDQWQNAQVLWFRHTVRFSLTIVFFYEYARGHYVLNGRVTCSLDSVISYSRSCIMCHWLMYLYVPFLSRVFLLHVPVWTVDSSPDTCLFPVSLFVLLTRLLTFLAYVFLLMSCRLVSQLVISGPWLVIDSSPFYELFVLVSR